MKMRLILILVGIVGLGACQQRAPSVPSPAPGLSEATKQYIHSISCANTPDRAKMEALQQEVTALRRQVTDLMKEAEHKSAIWQKQVAELAKTRANKRTVLQIAQSKIRETEAELLYEQIVSKCAK